MFNRSKALAVGLLVATFALGAAVGGAAWSAVQDGSRPPPRPGRERLSYAERLERDLGLTTAQRESVEVILDRRQAAMRAIWSEMEPRFDSLRGQIDNEIDAVLNEEQREELQRLRLRADSARRHRDSRGENERNQVDHWARRVGGADSGPTGTGSRASVSYSGRCHSEGVAGEPADGPGSRAGGKRSGQ